MSRFRPVFGLESLLLEAVGPRATQDRLIAAMRGWTLAWTERQGERVASARFVRRIATPADDY